METPSQKPVYESPTIIYEGKITTRAGSPFSVPLVPVKDSYTCPGGKQFTVQGIIGTGVPTINVENPNCTIGCQWSLFMADKRMDPTITFNCKNKQ